jgi:predicted nucleic acid-binding protein
MTDVLVDSDVLIDHLRGFRTFRPPSVSAFYSVITRAELFAGRTVDEAGVQHLLAPMDELTVSRAIAERAGRLRRMAQIQLGDALIAATALDHGLDLLTRNTRDFQRVPGLRIRGAD